MRKWILKLVSDALIKERPLFAVYVQNGARAIPLTNLEYIRTEFVPKVGEFIDLMVGDVIFVYEVLRVDHLYHYSSFDMQEGNILVKFVERIS